MVGVPGQHTLLVCLLIVIAKRTTSLQLQELHVPAHVPLGTRATLSCRWALGPADVLYSVKWYKDGREFFRHVPRDHEPRRKFPLPGVDVEASNESGSNVTLAPATLATEGRYRCEVSGEKPLFPTVSDHADLIVVVLPTHGPIISGFHPRYRPGDRVHVTCTSGGSRPMATLAWYINGEPAPASALTNVYDMAHGLDVSGLVLDFVVTEDYFRGDGFKVKCLATLPGLYWRSNEESAVREKTVHHRLIRVEHERDTRMDRVVTSSGERVHLLYQIVALVVIYLSCFTIF